MQREARALAALSHPNCVHVYDLVEEPDGLALVMEYLEGQPLAEIVDTAGPLDDVAAGRLWATMASALAAAHSKGVLHRDVKPSNVIIDPSGVAHLIDFGIARSRGDSKLTATGMMVGTPDYVAPETAAGARSEERRVGKECRSRWGADQAEQKERRRVCAAAAAALLKHTYGSS